MYIESFWVIVVAIWIAYLLWRTARWSKVATDYDKLFNELRKLKSIERRALWKQIVETDRKLLKKIPPAKRKDFLMAQAQMIICIAEEAIYEDEYKVGQFANTETFIVEGSPYDSIDYFFGSETAFFDEPEEKEQSLYEALEKMIK
jgi:hypothetical protein